jgi:acyl-CoA dehydrogenase
MIRAAAALFEAGKPCGEEANMAKLLRQRSGVQTHGGFAAAREFDVERKWREARISLIAPISTNLILAYIGQNVLGMPRSY